MRYNLGQTVELLFTITPDEAPTITVTAPDGTVSTPTVTVSTPTVTGAAGSYAALIDANQLGIWTYIWSTPNGGDQFGSFDVGRAVIPLAEVRKHLTVLTDKHDNELQLMLAAAAEMVAAVIAPQFLPLDVTGRPALRWALLELVRDMWAGLQTGGRFPGALPDTPDRPVGTAGRPALPPYVRSALAPYMSDAAYRAAGGGPVGSFPPAVPWPAG